MGYFSNGSEGEFFQAKYCERCVNSEHHNGGEFVGCAIWDAHLLFVDCSRTKGEPNDVAGVLNMLIPEDDACNGQCKLFRAAAPKEGL